MVLGPDPDEARDHDLTEHESVLDQLLQSVYGEKGASGFGRSNVRIRQWLEGIRANFPSEIVRIMQTDALERQGVKEMLLEPELLERIEPSVTLVSAILQLHQLLPEKTKKAARMLVSKLVQDIERKLKMNLIQAAQNSRYRKSKAGSPGSSRLDWRKTIARNLKNIQQDQITIIPEQWYVFRKSNQIPELFIIVDKSESMIESAIYASIIGSVLASLKSIRTHLIFFDTEILDLSGRYSDPVELLFSIPFGGGTDIALAVEYARQHIRNPSQTLFFLISDLYEGGNKKDLMQSLEILKDQGVSLTCLLSLSDEGKPDYNQALANELANLSIPCFSCPPDKFPELITGINS